MEDFHFKEIDLEAGTKLEISVADSYGISDFVRPRSGEYNSHAIRHTISPEESMRLKIF